jgi:ion channel-forming bestrophin family protein
MHAGKTYRLGEFLFWTRRNIFWLLVLSIIPTSLYRLFDLTWLAIPFTIIALLGTATAFIMTFRNQATYNRTWEARQIWGATMSRPLVPLARPVMQGVRGNMSELALYRRCFIEAY